MSEGRGDQSAAPAGVPNKRIHFLLSIALNESTVRQDLSTFRDLHVVQKVAGCALAEG